MRAALVAPASQFASNSFHVPQQKPVAQPHFDSSKHAARAAHVVDLADDPPPPHALPPQLGAGLLHERYRVPAPQLFEQEPHALHAPCTVGQCGWWACGRCGWCG